MSPARTDPGAAEILHDHYKETFAYIHKREAERDRLFLVLLALLAVLVAELRYAAALVSALQEVGVAGVKLDVSRLPMPVLVSLTWTFICVLLLRYFQTVIWVNGQYDYVHDLERRLCDHIGERGIIGREGTAYYSDSGSPLRNGAWLFYVAVFPLIIAVTVLWSVVYEYRQHGYCFPYDSAIALLSLVFLIIYLRSQWLGSGRGKNPK